MASGGDLFGEMGCHSVGSRWEIEGKGPVEELCHSAVRIWG